MGDYILLNRTRLVIKRGRGRGDYIWLNRTRLVIEGGRG